MNNKIFKCLMIVSCCVLLNACSSIEPWVKPYERQRLSNSIMQKDRHPIASNHAKHVYEAREAARGASGAGGGGCGCN